MKYIKKFEENNIEPEVGDYVAILGEFENGVGEIVAIRPDRFLKFEIYFNEKPDNDPPLYNTAEIMFISKNKEEVYNYIEKQKLTDKFNV